MLPHQVNILISKEQMEGFTHVDITVGEAMDMVNFA
jgi:hypothetical protein